MNAKTNEQKAVRKSVSMPSKMANFMARMAEQKGFATFSDYLQDLVRAEMQRQQA